MNWLLTRAAAMALLQAFSAFVFVGTSLGQQYPNRPIRIIVPFPPGGTTDIAARHAGQELSRSLKQPVIIENRPGANGNLGADAAAKSAPDGYTLLHGNLGILGINPSIYQSLPYSAEKDFTPVSRLAISPLLLIVNPSLKIGSVTALIELARREPGKLSYASIGNGSSSHMAGAMLNHMAGINVVHVPYGGAPQAATAVASGEVAYTFGGQGPSWVLVDAGKVHAFAITGGKRSTERPHTPTMIESGVKGYEMADWNGILVPAGTPQEIVNKLNEEISQALRIPTLRSRYLAQGLEPSGSSPSEFAAFIQAEKNKWAEVSRIAKIKAD